MERAFLFDLFCRPEGMVLYLILASGERVRCCDRFTPSVYLAGSPTELSRCLATLSRWSAEVEVVGQTTRRDFWTGDLIPVTEVRLLNPFRWHRELLDRLYRLHPDIHYYNVDLLPEQHYLFERDLVPLGWCEFEVGDDGWVERIESRDNQWAQDYSMPELVHLELEGKGRLYGGAPHLDELVVRVDGREYCFDGTDPVEMIASLNRLVQLHDPDVILTRGGDSLLFPLLFIFQQQVRDWDGEMVPLQLDREAPPVARKIRVEGRSFFSYGRVFFQAPDYPLFGRWHLDLENSFIAGQSGLYGLYEVTRVSKMPIQRIGRRSIGTGITSVQLDVAYHEGLLIPWKKSVPEGWKTAAQLLVSDRGGFVYQPYCGAYEDVIEIDFVSMYPTIMSEFNVSPETVNCRCCDNEAVPELGYTICEKRQGLVARALAPLIKKRVDYKERRNAARLEGNGELAEKDDARQTALKWLLVCCFGYLGYRNARFGRIEAHEAVCAFSRDRLMVAREVCERRGFRVLHGIVDCFWCQRDPEHFHLGRPSREEIESLCAEILQATGLPIALEGVYRWIAFLPSRQNPEMPVPNRFFGRFEDGSFKMRGIEARRSDQPPYIREWQKQALEMLTEAENLAGYRALVPELMRMLAQGESALERHEIALDELLVTVRLSKDPEEYRSNHMAALAARQGVMAGIPLRAGQPVAYLIVSQGDRDVLRRVCLAQLLQPETSYDALAYRRLLRRGFQSLLSVVGVVLDEEPERGAEKKQQGAKGEFSMGV